MLTFTETYGLKYGLRFTEAISMEIVVVLGAIDFLPGAIMTTGMQPIRAGKICKEVQQPPSLYMMRFQTYFQFFIVTTRTLQIPVTRLWFPIFALIFCNLQHWTNRKNAFPFMHFTRSGLSTVVAFKHYLQKYAVSTSLCFRIRIRRAFQVRIDAT